MLIQPPDVVESDVIADSHGIYVSQTSLAPAPGLCYGQHLIHAHVEWHQLLPGSNGRALASMCKVMLAVRILGVRLVEIVNSPSSSVECVSPSRAGSVPVSFPVWPSALCTAVAPLCLCGLVAFDLLSPLSKVVRVFLVLLILFLVIVLILVLFLGHLDHTGPQTRSPRQHNLLILLIHFFVSFLLSLLTPLGFMLLYAACFPPSPTLFPSVYLFQFSVFGDVLDVLVDGISVEVAEQHLALSLAASYPLLVCILCALGIVWALFLPWCASSRPASPLPVIQHNPAWWLERGATGTPGGCTVTLVGVMALVTCILQVDLWCAQEIWPTCCRWCARPRERGVSLNWSFWWCCRCPIPPPSHLTLFPFTFFTLLPTTLLMLLLLRSYPPPHTPSNLTPNI
eukprot:comp17839_c2_seq1/m.17994 comp17839_c2_seq1/g.17994  ORF comp17839_c2_seq1/g.17994 comp17839_c2_seq1/m.17994 type:complete len:398 (+) comp17839_c2_seq1:598-1791(+)